MVRVAVLGAGSHSSIEHGPALQRCRAEAPTRVQLTAVCDLDRDRARQYADRFGFSRVYTDFRKMVTDEDLDGIVAVTALDRTPELAAAVAELGVPLVIEKPPGRSGDAACRLRDAVAASGTPHMVSLNRRFSPAVRRAREWLSGRPSPQLAVSRMVRHARREGRFVFDTGIHAADTVVAFLGEPTRVDATSIGAGAQGVGLFGARVEFSGAVALFCFAPASGVREETLELFGADYDIQVDVEGCGVRILDGGQVVLDWRKPAGTPAWEASGTLDEMRAFLACLEGDAPWWPDLREAVWSARMAEAVQAGWEGPLSLNE